MSFWSVLVEKKFGGHYFNAPNIAGRSWQQIFVESAELSSQNAERLKKDEKFWGTSAKDLYFVGADLSSMESISGKDVDLSQANFAKANLQGVGIFNADFSKANLAGADFSNTYLMDVTLPNRGPLLKGLNLTGARIYRQISFIIDGKEEQFKSVSLLELLKDAPDSITFDAKNPPKITTEY